MKAYFVLLFTCIGAHAFGQITTTETRAKTDSVKAFASENPTHYYLGAGRNNSFRVLEPNDAPYGRPLGYREDEERLKIWSYELGLRTSLNKYLQFDGGVALERFGEKYASVPQIETGDSAYAYTTRYNYISLPLQLYGTVGQDFKLYAGGGLVPGIVGAYSKEITVTDSIGNSSTETINQPEKLASFLLSARVSTGLQWKWNKYAGVYVNYTYQFGLSSTLGPQDPYKHYLRSGSVRFGLTFIIPE